MTLLPAGIISIGGGEKKTGQYNCATPCIMGLEIFQQFAKNVHWSKANTEITFYNAIKRTMVQ